MKRAIFTFLASFLASFSGAQMLPDSIEHFLKYGPDYEALPYKTVIYKYDTTGRVIEETILAQRVLNERFTYSFVDGRMVEKQVDWFNQDGNFQWTPQTKWTTIYNAAGVDTGRIEYMYNKSTNNWEIRVSRFYALSFDTQDRLIEQLTLRMNTSTNLLENYQRDRYVYVDSDMEPDSIIYSENIDNVWVDFQRAADLSWYGGFKSDSINHYPSNAQCFEKVNGSWEPNVLVQSIYEDDRLTEYHMYFTAVNDTNPWYMSWYYTYDSLGSQTFFQQFNFENGINSLLHQRSDTFRYAGSGAILEHVSVTKIGTGKKEIYYYSKWPTGLEAYQIAENIYPNPLSPSQKLFVKSEQTIEQVNLYSVDGALLRNWIAPNGEGLDIQGIAPGLYFIHLKDEDGNTSTQRLMIK